MKNLNSLKCSILFISILLLSSCQKNDSNPQPNPQKQYQEFAPITMGQIQYIERILNNEGINLGQMNVSNMKKQRAKLGIETKSASDTVLRVIKVSYDTPDPSDSSKMLQCSGILLIPNSTKLNYRIMVIPPPTYSLNSMAPSNFFKNFADNLQKGELRASYLYLYALQASYNFAVFMPDYAGFGDSYGKCFSPYVVQKPQVSDAIDLIKTGETVLKDLNYAYKPKILVSGYSQGAFVATSLVRQLETNPSYGISVAALAAGGTPCNLKQMVDIARSNPTLPDPMFLPYMFFGYKSNGYLDLDNAAVMKEPYASVALGYFDGTRDIGQIDSYFPVETDQFVADGVLASDFDTNPIYTAFNKVLNENSIKPWKNVCDFKMYHGSIDSTVYYQQANDFAAQENAFGGNVEFNVVPGGNHSTSVIPFTIASHQWFLNYQ